MSNSVPTTLQDAPTLADLRQSTGMTQRKAAAVMGMKHPRVAQIEHTGILSNDIERIEAIATAYNVEVQVVREANDRTKNR